MSSATKISFDELVEATAVEGFGETPAFETMFAEIEQFGHRVGRMPARAVDEKVTADHASTHFQEEQPCPKCGQRLKPTSSCQEDDRDSVRFVLCNRREVA